MESTINQLQSGAPDITCLLTRRRRNALGRLLPAFTKAWSCVRHFCCRLDVCWTFAFFLLLVIIGAITTAVTQTLIARALLDILHEFHYTRLESVLYELEIINDRASFIAASTLSLHLQDAPQLNSEANLRFLTSTLDKFPDTRFDRIFMYSLRTLEGVGCMRVFDLTNNTVEVGGYFSENTIVKYTYLVDTHTYKYARPLEIVAEWPVSRQNLSQTTPVFYGNVPVLKLAPAYYNGSIDAIDPQLFWQNAIPIPHLQFYYLPYGVVARGQPLPPGRYADDFIIVCVDGSKFLTAYGNTSDGFSAATFIRATLGDAHPKLYSNNWGQPAVINLSIFAPMENTANSYVDTTTITDPLMRAALRHADLKAMKVTGYTHTADFEYKGAYATVTANTHLTRGGLVIAIVLASAHNHVTKDYLTVLRICNCMTAVAIVLFTAIFWWFVHNEYSRPLEQMTVLLLRSVQTGRRATLRLTRRTFIQLSESAQLIRAFNDCVRRLREIDAFIPEDVRRLFLQRQRRLSICEGSISHSSLSSEMAVVRSTRRRDTLRPHHVTMAHVTVRAWTAHAEAEAAAAAAVAGGGAVALHGGGARRGQRLAAVVERAAHAGGVANSGAFASAAAVAAFSAAVHELAAQHGGLVRNLTPDGCVVHFMAAVCAHLPRHGGAERGGGAEYDPAPLRACIDADAYAGLAFALALQRWVDARSGADTAGTAAAAAAMPDVRCLVDTGVYTCGQYRAPGSEQTLTVALGRDAQRVVGRAAALLGVRVAMTEETAVRVRPGPRAATEPGVRQLPVEALRTGRAGLDADAVILYEVLPGAAAGDAAWLAYARCCFDGFECMVRGDYAGALRAYRGVGEIGDLEPGLLPRCLSREAAHSDAVGGAVSVQVQRMMAECERRDRLQMTTGYHREARSPLGIDAVLRGMPLEMRVCVGSRSSMCSFTSASGMSSGRRRTGLPRSLRVLSGPDTVRLVVVVPTAGGECRCVIGGKPDAIVDNFGTSWLLSRRSFEESPMEPWRTHCFALSSAGAICIASFLPFRELQPLLTKAIAGAPRGPMSDALRSAVPVHDATAKQRRAVDHLCVRRQHLDHPNLLRYSSYSLSVEGGLVMMKTFAPGGTLRQVLRRYPNISFMARARFALSILSGLAYLHANGCVHGAVSVDSIVVCGDGQCRLRGYFVDYALAESTFLLPCTCYVSPAMAAGHSPTSECDVFCYGLLWIEGLSGKRPWRWAWNRDGEPVGTEQELEELIEEGGQRFCAAVDEGRVVVAKELMELACVKRLLPPIAWDSVMRCVSSEVSDRPTSLWLFLAMKSLIGICGTEVEEDGTTAKGWVD